MPKKDYTAEKESLFKRISKEDLEIIQKGYLDKKARNAKIRELLRQGFCFNLLSEVTGLSYSVIWNIDLSNPNGNKLSRKGLIKMKAALDTFSKEISIILDGLRSENER